MGANLSSIPPEQFARNRACHAIAMPTVYAPSQLVANSTFAVQQMTSSTKCVLNESFNMARSYPRLLFATEYAPRSRGGGLVFMRQMLKGWPADRLWWWSCRPSAPDGEGQPVAGHFVTPLPNRLYPAFRYAKVRAWMMEVLWTPLAAAHLQRTIRVCKPDVVWVIPQQWSIPPLVRVLGDGRMPFRVSMHDFADLRNVVQRLGAGVARRLARGADLLYAAAHSRDAICAPMVADLQQRTGASGWINRVGLEGDDIAFLEQKQPRELRELRLVFAGTIIADEAFRFFIRALAGIRDRLPLPLQMEFYGAYSHAQQPWFDPSWMRERCNAPEPEFRAGLRGCTWGVSPVSLADEDPRYHRFSFPAKVSSYLGAGLPVLALGHPASSLIELTRRTNIGAHSTCSDLSGLQADLLAVLTAEDPWVRHGADILRCVRQEFDAGAMRARLHQELFSAATVRAA